MIKLTKRAKPAVLAANAADWSAKLLKHIKNGTPIPDALATSYNQDEVKLALNTETHGKCMYCESKIAHVTYAHIEHYKPKKKTMFPELAFDWDNLGLACPKCNHNKLDKFDAGAPFINPYVDDPRNHFRAEGPFVHPVPGDARAEITELELELNRPELVERRDDRLKDLRRLIRCYNTTAVAALKAELLRQIKEEIRVVTEYSFVASHHAYLFIPAAAV